METSTVTTKGQVVIPAKLRAKLGIKPGTKVSFEAKDDVLILHSTTDQFYEKARGILKGRADLFGDLKRLRREDDERMKAKYGL